MSYTPLPTTLNAVMEELQKTTGLDYNEPRSKIYIHAAISSKNKTINELVFENQVLKRVFDIMRPTSK